ncbi:MAG: tRNA preQ1(34) S-adenosylmethionine ribosyltransferase-isomerase QueA [Candidatus Moraniibacteriota bacterium]
MRIEDLHKYDYVLPPELIRKKPLEPRDSARLFVYDTKSDTVAFDTFRNLTEYLPRETLLVVNNTQVLPARLFLKKETGGKIEVLVLANEIQSFERIPIIVDRKTEIGAKLFFPNGDFFTVLWQEENVFFVRLTSTSHLFHLLEQFGTTPVPHYLEGEEKIEEKELRKRYQTIFAHSGASVAAPTASLHFTDVVFESLAAKGIGKTEITLNVGLGTFAPLSSENFETGKLHTEYVAVSGEAARTLNVAKGKGAKIIAVGTTVTRTLETIGKNGACEAYSGPLDTFIFPPHHFNTADILLTNFHLPKTSLMLLVDAFLQDRGAQRGIMDLYALAIQEKFSFYSFGDSMLIL